MGKIRRTDVRLIDHDPRDQPAATDDPACSPRSRDLAKWLGVEPGEVRADGEAGEAAEAGGQAALSEVMASNMLGSLAWLSWPIWPIHCAA